MPLLSIMVPTYNRLEMFRTCFESLLRTSVDAEIIVLDNGSSDGTADYLSQVKDPRVRAFRHKTNREDPYSELFSLATGKYMTWMGDDDWALPGGYEALVGLLEQHPDVDLAYSLANKVDGKGNLIGTLQWPGLLDHAYIGDRNEFSDLFIACYLSPQTAVYRRSLYDELGGFDTKLFAAADWDMMLRYVAGRKTAFLPVPTVAIRFHQQSGSESLLKSDSGFARGRIALWRKWLIEHPNPTVLGDFGWRRLADAFLPDLRHEYGTDLAKINDFMQQLFALKDEVRWRQNEKILGWRRPGEPSLEPWPAQVLEPHVEDGPPSSNVGVKSPFTPLRILFASEYFVPMIGGAEMAANELLQAFAARGHLARALCPGDDLPLFQGGVELRPIKTAEDITTQIQEFHPSVILTQGHLAPLAIGLAKAKGIPVWFYVHALDHVCPRPEEMVRCDRDCGRCPLYAAARGDMDAQKLAIRSADRVFTPSAFAATELERFTGRKGIEILPPPTQLFWMEAAGERPYITFSTAAPFKGLFTFLEITRAFPKEQFLIVGRRDPTDSGVDLTHYPNVTYWGVVPTESFLKVTKVLLVPSVLAETFGRVVPEAQAAGSIVIASRYGGLVESVGEGGLLVSPHTDAKAWIQALHEVLARPDLRDTLTAKGRSQAKKAEASSVAPAFVLTVEAFMRTQVSPKHPVIWEGAQFVYHSLAHVNRQLCMALIGSGQVELSLRPYGRNQFDVQREPNFAALADRMQKPLSVSAQVHVRHHWPPNFNPPPEGAWVMIQPWEYGGIPREWIKPMCELVDEIWVPSSWVRDCYVSSGIPAEKVQVIPNGVDINKFNPEGPKYPLNTKKAFKFLYLGGTIHRKGIDILLRAYLKAFRSSDDVCLVIKGQSGDTYAGSELHDLLASIIKEDPKAPAIEYLTSAMSEEELTSLYRSCDALAMPYRGEGFGLPMAEAIASGLPVIATGCGAAMDFLTEDWAYFIPSTPQKIESVPVGPFKPSEAGFWLEEPDEPALTELLRKVFMAPKEAARKGLNGRAYAVEHLSWSIAAERALERIEILSNRTPFRFQEHPAKPHREAFLLKPNWADYSWVEVLIAYAKGFRPGEPVALVVFIDANVIDPAEAQESILSVLAELGDKEFADIVLIDNPTEVIGALQSYDSTHWISNEWVEDATILGAQAKRLFESRRNLALNTQ